MKVEMLTLQGLKLITPLVFKDDRGFFLENYQKTRYESEEILPFVQDNLSFSIQNTIRALHYQERPGQAKLISCLQGTIWDVVVDIRPNSLTFLKWEAAILDDQKHQQLYVPIGFAHGFCVLSESALVSYKVSSPYNPKTEKSIRWNDPEINIEWPVKSPILSLRDQSSPFLKDVHHALDCWK